jgi:hypothetical protein
MILRDSTMTKHLPGSWSDMRRNWGLLTAYQRFETLVAFVLTRHRCRHRGGGL